jgi:AraC-like DNA-binding protein
MRPSRDANTTGEVSSFDERPIFAERIIDRARRTQRGETVAGAKDMDVLDQRSLGCQGCLRVASRRAMTLQPTEHLYYTATTGHLFAAETVLFTKLRLPWYGMISISMDREPIQVIAEGRTFEARALAIHARNVKFIASPTRYVSVVANPLHENFRAFTRLDPPVLELDRSVFAQFDAKGEEAVRGTLSGDGAVELYDGIHAASRSLLPVSVLDDRAEVLVKTLWETPECSVEHLAERLGLSYYRTSHFFTQTVGISLRSYQLWQKLYKSGAPLLRGASLTEAAHAAGFVDSAHYARAFQKAYGRAPSRIFRSRRVKVHYTNPVREARGASSPLPREAGES